MRTFLVLICSLALACVALGEEQGKKKEQKSKKKAAHAGQVSQPAGKGAGKPTTVGGPSGAGKAKITGQPSGAGKPSGMGKAKIAGKPTGAGKPAVAGGPAGKKFQAQHFNLPTKPSATIASTKFQANRRIQGSQSWQGSNYTVFRNYTSQWHDRIWWSSHYSRVIANAKAALQQQGYYRGQVDGLLGPLTRAAVADYQRDHGLYITSAIDRPTLSSLGLA